MNDTIIVMENQENLTQCQLKYLLEWNNFGERVCFKWAQKNRCLASKLLTIQKQLINKNREISNLKQVNSQCKKELQSERNKMYNIAKKMKEHEKRFKERIRQVENSLLDREQELYRRCSEHSLSEIEKEFELFVEKESMFKNFRQIENSFDELNYQYTTFVHSLSLENKYLRLDIVKIDANYDRQLADIRSVNEKLNKALANQIQCADNERNQLTADNTKLLQNNLLEVQKMERLIAIERTLNVKLDDEVLRLQKEMVEKDEFLNRKMYIIVEKTKNKMIIDNQTVIDLNQKIWSEKISQLDKTIYRLEDCVPLVGNTLATLKSKNEVLINKLNQMQVQFMNVTSSVKELGMKLRNEIIHLKNDKYQVHDLINQLKSYIPKIEKIYTLKLENQKANQINQFNDAIESERNTNSMLQDEVAYLKNENNRKENMWKLKVHKQLIESKNEMTVFHKNTLNKLYINLERAVKKEHYFKSILAEISISSNDKDQIIILNDHRITQLQFSVKDLNSRLAEQEATKTEHVKLIETYKTQLDSMQKKYTKLKKRLHIKSNKKLKQEGISLGDPKVTIALENNIHDRYYIQIDGQKSKIHTESNNLEHNATMEPTYRVVKEVRSSCPMPKNVIDMLNIELCKKANLPE